eukprot:2456950-Pleurochrysis_carterae.AAC.2
MKSRIQVRRKGRYTEDINMYKGTRSLGEGERHKRKGAIGEEHEPEILVREKSVCKTEPSASTLHTRSMKTTVRSTLRKVSTRGDLQPRVKQPFSAAGGIRRQTSVTLKKEPPRCALNPQPLFQQRGFRCIDAGDAFSKKTHLLAR